MGALTTNAKFDLFGNGLPDDVLVRAFTATEILSQPFCIVIEFSTSDASFDVEQCLRSRLLLAVTNEAHEQRYFDGVVQEARFVRVRGELLVFEVVLGPSVQALQYREDCRIFQEKTIVDVVKEIFDEAGITETVEWKLSGNYPERDFIVQYRETTFAFVSRLLEDNGIFYFFQHGEDGHRMILADSPEAFGSPEDGPMLALSSRSAGFEPMEEFSRKRTLGRTSVHLRDFDFEKPGVRPESELPYQDAWFMPYYEYPGGFVTAAEAARKAKARMIEHRAVTDVSHGTSAAIALCPGNAFSVEDTGDQNLDGQYVVTALYTTGTQRKEGAQNWACSNRFSAIPVGTPFAPPRITPRPRIRGIQTAIVTGEANEEQGIHTEMFGRIKVRFYWDRVGQQDHTSSCWIRVAQVQMGGTMVLPRLGWEVSVAFLEGDPDRPLVLGRLYNGGQSMPMGLPGAKASGCLRSMSSPGAAGHNEISMGDSGGGQGHGMKAQKDLNMTTGNNVVETIGVDDTHTVNANMSRQIGANETITVGANQTLSVGANQNTKIGGDQSITVGGNDQSNATGNLLEKIAGSRTYTVGGNEIVISNAQQRDIQGSFTRTVGAVEIKLAAGSISDNVLGTVSSSVGAVRLHLVAGSHGENVAGAKSETTSAAAAHLTKGDFNSEAQGAKATTVGGIHFRKISGDFSLKAPMITLAGAVGQFKGGSSKLCLNGGPIVLKGSKIVGKTAMVKKTGGTLKLG